MLRNSNDLRRTTASLPRLLQFITQALHAALLCVLPTGLAKTGLAHYDSPVKGSPGNTTIPVPGSKALVQDLAATAADTGLRQADVIRQSLKLGMPVLRERLRACPRHRLPLWEHFKRLKGLELPPWLE